MDIPAVVHDYVMLQVQVQITGSSSGAGTGCRQLSCCRCRLQVLGTWVTTSNVAVIPSSSRKAFPAREYIHTYIYIYIYIYCVSNSISLQRTSPCNVSHARAWIRASRLTFKNAVNPHEALSDAVLARHTLPSPLPPSHPPLWILSTCPISTCGMPRSVFHSVMSFGFAKV